jgi:hypothetical protein
MTPFGKKVLSEIYKKYTEQLSPNPDNGALEKIPFNHSKDLFIRKTSAQATV